MDLASLLFVWHHKPEATAASTSSDTSILGVAFWILYFSHGKHYSTAAAASCLADYCKALLNSPSMLLLAIRPSSLLSSDYFFQIFLHSLLHWSELSVVINSLVKPLWNPITPTKIKICHFFFHAEWLRNKNESRNMVRRCSWRQHISRGTSVSLWPL